MQVNIRAIPETEMRYPTVGDWWFEEDTLHIRVLDNLPENEQFLIALHELVEVWLCKNRGITTEVVDSFDFDPKHQGDFEPGDLPDSPYRREHRFAMLVEHLMAHELGMVGYGEVS